MANNNTGYLITPTKTLKHFILKSDREYFSRPILVELLYSELSTKFLWVRDPHRGHTYPTLPQYVVAEGRLTNQQRALMDIHQREEAA
jgi:hypothetical protein